jgi:arylformamidase
MNKYFDISPPLTESTAVFPGDQPLRRRVQMSFSKGNHLELSDITTTLHLGAHADSPGHYSSGGSGIGERDIKPYLGRAQLVKVNVARSERVGRAHWGDRQVLAPRVLICTNTFPDPNQWTGDFASLDPELIDWLAGQKVRLVGIDTPSVDPAESKALEAHQALARHDLSVLEGLVLGDVPEGIYNLVALPLRLQGMDASPVRAVLLSIDFDHFAE